MKLKLTYILVILALLSCTREKSVDTIGAGSAETHRGFDGVVIQKQSEPDSLKKSIKAYATTTLGDAIISITYHSPAVRNRIIWGGLIPFDQVWVTGAHMATTFESNRDLIIDNQIIPAGKYGLFTILSEDQWIFILNRNWQQHLSDEYDQKDDLIRQVITTQIADHQERLRYDLIAADSSTFSIVMQWEKIQLAIPIKLK